MEAWHVEGASLQSTGMGTAGHETFSTLLQLQADHAGDQAAEADAPPQEGVPLPRWDLSGLVGKQIMYAYSNGWQYEVVYRSEDTIDYRVLSGLVSGRVVKAQKVHMRQLGRGHSYMVTWTEPTGTSVSQVINLESCEINTVAFFPRWVHNDPSKTICCQNDHLDLMLSYRDKGPTYPIEAVNMYGRIHFVKDCLPTVL